MTKTKSIYLALVAVLLSPMANADLIGDEVTVELVGNSSYGEKTVTVGAGEETNYFENQFIDFDGTTFSVRSTGGYSSIDGPGGSPILWVLTGLDFGAPLLGVNFLIPFSDVSVASLTSNSVTFSYFDIAIPVGTYFSVEFLTDRVDVPEPGTLALLGLGLIGMAARRRKKV